MDRQMDQKNFQAGQQRRQQGYASRPWGNAGFDKEDFKQWKEESVVVTHIVDATTFYGQICNPQTATVYQNMISQFLHHCSSSPPPATEINVNQIYGAVFTVDNSGWYRCQLKRIDLATGKLLVQFVDYGNEETVDSVVELPPVVAQIPFFAAKMSLYGMEPGFPNKASANAQKAFEYLSSLPEAENVTVHISNTQPNPQEYSVVVFLGGQNVNKFIQNSFADKHPSPAMSPVQQDGGANFAGGRPNQHQRNWSSPPPQGSHDATAALVEQLQNEKANLIQKVHELKMDMQVLKKMINSILSGHQSLVDPPGPPEGSPEDVYDQYKAWLDLKTNKLKSYWKETDESLETRRGLLAEMEQDLKTNKLKSYWKETDESLETRRGLLAEMEQDLKTNKLKSYWKETDESLETRRGLLAEMEQTKNECGGNGRRKSTRNTRIRTRKKSEEEEDEESNRTEENNVTGGKFGKKSKSIKQSQGDKDEDKDKEKEEKDEDEEEESIRTLFAKNSKKLDGDVQSNYTGKKRRYLKKDTKKPRKKSLSMDFPSRLLLAGAVTVPLVIATVCARSLDCGAFYDSLKASINVNFSNLDYIFELITASTNPGFCDPHKNKNCDKFLLQKLRNLGLKYDDQSSDTWSTLFTAALDHVSYPPNPQGPVVIMVYRLKNGSRVTKILEDIAAVYGSVFPPKKDYGNIIIKGKSFTSSSPEEAQKQIQDMLERGFEEAQKVAIVYDFDKLPSCSVLTFQNYGNNVAIILTITGMDEKLPSNPKSRDLEEAVSKLFHEKWKDCPGKIDVMLSRVANYIVLLR